MEIPENLTAMLTKYQYQSNREELFQRYSSLYPDAKVSNWFLLNVQREEKLEAPCADCNGYPCAKKADKGYRYKVSVERGELMLTYAKCDLAVKEEQKKKILARFDRAKIPAMYEGKTYDNYEVDSGNEKAVAMAKYIVKTGEGLYLVGSPGTGKTFLAAIIAQELLNNGKSVIFGDVPSLLEQLKGSYSAESEASIEELMKTLTAADMLVLDDLGTENPTEWAVERLYLIINNRYTEQKPIIVTSNYGLGTTAARLNKPKNGKEGVTGSRIVSRLKQMCKVAEIKGEDRRFRR